MEQQLFAQSLCASFNFDALREYLLSAQRCSVYNGAIHIEWQSGEIIVFNYGVIVCWNLNNTQRNDFIDSISEYMIDSHSEQMHDEFSYETGSETLQIKNDHLKLPDDSMMARLAISHGAAQSTKLAQFEWQILQTINNTNDIPKKIAETGSSQLSRSQIAKLRGRLFIAKSDITLNYDLLDVPDFFWEYPELEPYYHRIADYLDLKQRVSVLSKKLETIHELFDMMAEEQKHKHSSLLEWIIIWLIAFEIIVFLFHDIFKVF